MDKNKQRFDSFYKVVDGCFIWQKHLDKDGYGIFYFKQKNRKAHRVSYYFTHGAIPNGMVIDHICKQRSCVNSQHLRCVTKKQNTLENSRSVGAINKMKQFCKNNHPFDRKYGKQRYCSICSSEKSKRLQKKWLVSANKILC